MSYAWLEILLPFFRIKHTGNVQSLVALLQRSRHISSEVLRGRFPVVSPLFSLFIADRFAIPFTFSTTLGLAAIALSVVPSPSSPVNDPTSSGFIPLLPTLSDEDISAGLPASVAAAVLLGKSGAAALLILLFLAVTSATSAEMIAVSSILTYDVYVRYINPQATEEQVLRMSHIGVRRHTFIFRLTLLLPYNDRLQRLHSSWDLQA